jgi:hypothetical protein
MEVDQNEQNENGNVDILSKEIESWKDFSYALVRCFLTVNEIKTTSELLSQKVETIQLNRYSYY